VPRRPVRCLPRGNGGRPAEEAIDAQAFWAQRPLAMVQGPLAPSRSPAHQLFTAKTLKGAALTSIPQRRAAAHRIQCPLHFTFSFTFGNHNRFPVDFSAEDID